MSVSSRAITLRNQLDSGQILTVPGAFDALSASMIERTGFKAVYATGAGIANAHLGVPDLGLLTLTELVSIVKTMSAVTTVPLIVDIDTGFGGVHSVARVIHELEDLDVAAVQIEDQTFPKRCGHFEGKQVIAVEEMVEKILAIMDTRRGDLVVIARTDAVAIEGFDAAIERACLYANAGADMIFVEAMRTEEQIRQASAHIPAPLVMNFVEGGKTPFLAIDDLEALGYRIALFANFALRVAMKALTDQLSLLHRAGTSRDLMEEMLPWGERQEAVGLSRFEALETGWKERGQMTVRRSQAGRAPNVR